MEIKNYKRIINLLDSLRHRGLYCNYEVCSNGKHRTYINNICENPEDSVDSKYYPHHQEHKSIEEACIRFEEFLNGGYELHKKSLLESIEKWELHIEELKEKLNYHINN